MYYFSVYQQFRLLYNYRHLNKHSSSDYVLNSGLLTNFLESFSFLLLQSFKAK